MGIRGSNINKKGQISSIFGSMPAILISLILVVVLGAVISIMIGSTKDNLSREIFTTTNESITFTSGGGVTSAKEDVTTTGTILSNTTNSTTATNNYDVFSNGSIIFKDLTVLNGGATYNFTYSHKKNSAAQQVLGNSSLSIVNTFKQFGTVGTVIGVMLILGAVLFFLGRRKQEGF